jgi:hypothetical protein
MKIRPIVIGMAACFVFSMAGSNAGVVFDVGLNQASAGANFERGVVNTAEIFWRQEDGDHCGRGDHRHWDNGDKGDHGKGDGDHDKDDHDKGDHDKGDHDKGDHGKKCCNGDHRDWNDGDHDHDNDCEKSPSKPPHH